MKKNKELIKRSSIILIIIFCILCIGSILVTDYSLFLGLLLGWALENLRRK